MTNAISNNVTMNTPSEPTDRARTSSAPSVGLITPPDKSFTPKLLPDDVKNKASGKLNYDEFDKVEKKSDFSDKVKTPIGVKIIFSALGLLALFFGAKKYGSKILELFKNKH